MDKKLDFTWRRGIQHALAHRPDVAVLIREKVDFFSFPGLAKVENVDDVCDAVEETLRYGLAQFRRVRMDRDRAGAQEALELVAELNGRMQLERD